MADYAHTTPDGDCIFCKIADGTFPPMGNGLIYEDADYMAWLSPFPNTLGYTVVIPKHHFPSDVLAMPDQDYQALLLAAKKVAALLENYFSDVGRVGVLIEGTGIDHAHIKLFPMHGTDHMKSGVRKQYHSQEDLYIDQYDGYISIMEGPQADFVELSELAAKIRASAD